VRVDAGAAGGGRGIRTLDTVSRIHAFQACAFSHSATPPHDGRALGEPGPRLRAQYSQGERDNKRSLNMAGDRTEGERIRLGRSEDLAIVGRLLGASAATRIPALTSLGPEDQAACRGAPSCRPPALSSWAISPDRHVGGEGNGKRSLCHQHSSDRSDFRAMFYEGGGGWSGVVPTDRIGFCGDPAHGVELPCSHAYGLVAGSPAGPLPSGWEVAGGSEAGKVSSKASSSCASRWALPLLCGLSARGSAWLFLWPAAPAGVWPRIPRASLKFGFDIELSYAPEGRPASGGPPQQAIRWFPSKRRFPANGADGEQDPTATFRQNRFGAARVPHARSAACRASHAREQFPICLQPRSP
jgi:hypothetical protein